MNFPNFFGKKNQNNLETAEVENNEAEEKVSAGTKVKVVLALVVVGFAAYVAYWVQDPTDFKADLLTTQENAVTQAESTQDLASQSSQLESTTTEESEQSGYTQEVGIVDFGFNPETINISKGTTVVWTNKDPVSHTVTGPDFKSQTLNSGDSFTYTFNDDATVQYSCDIHPQMKGTLVVGAGSGDALTQTTETQSTQATQDVLAIPTNNFADLSEADLDYETGLSLSANSDLAAKMAQELAMQQAKAAQNNELHGAAYTQTPKPKGKLAQSGPEDILYVAAFGVILFLNRKKLFRALS